MKKRTLKEQKMIKLRKLIRERIQLEMNSIDADEKRKTKEIRKIIKQSSVSDNIKILRDYMDGVLVKFKGKHYPAIPSELESEIFDYADSSSPYLIRLKDK